MSRVWASIILVESVIDLVGAIFWTIEIFRTKEEREEKFKK